MQFNSFSDFVAMGGYGFYVWLAFGISALAMLILWLSTKVKRQQLEQSVVREYRRRERIKDARTKQRKETTL